MGSLLCHPAFFQDYDMIGSRNSAQPMGNDQYRLPLHQPVDRLLYKNFIFRIKGGGGLV